MSDGDSWDDWADGWDDDPGARAYSRAAYASLRDDLERRGIALTDTRVLDFGCGTGLLTEQLVDAVESVHAVDVSPKMLAVLDAKIDENRWTSVATSVAVPDNGERWDLIVCSSVCSFLDDYPGTIASLAGRLNPGGVFMQWDWEAAEADDAHGLTRTAIAAALDNAGLTETEVRVAFSIPFEDQTMEPLLGSGVRR